MRTEWTHVALGLLVGSLSLASNAQITVDGVLEEPEWDKAQVFKDFVTTEPLTGEPAKYDTTALVHTDDSGIYIGFINYQPREVNRIQRRFARDTFINADRNIIGIDFDGNGLTGYDFTVGIANSQQDGIFSNEKEYRSDWDGTWYSQTSQNDDYWYTEVHIPWTVAPMTRSEADTKRMQFYFGRFVYDEGLRFATPNASFQRPTFLSDWQGVEVAQVNSSTLDWFPYISGVADLDDSGDDPDDFKAGLDLVWRPDSGTQLTATLNPDFGQVEADDIVVNFSAFETFFQERRPFFTENQGMFDIRVPGGDYIIHTRRIGAAPDVGTQPVSDILGGAKFTHYGQSLDYGGFAVSEDDTGQADGRDYATTRVQGRFEEQSLSLGHSLTYADRPTLDRDALVTGIDADWQGIEGLRVWGQVLYSDIQQDANAANGDIDQDDQDMSAWTQVRYSDRDINEYELNLIYYGDEFDMNDMGFLRRNDWFRQSAQYRRNTNFYPEDSALLNTYWRVKPAREENADGDQLLAGVDLQYFWGMRSTEQYTIQLHTETVHRRDDLITRGNGTAKLDPQHSLLLQYLSPRGDDFNFALTYVAETKGTDKFAHEFDFEPQFYATDTFTLGGEVSYTWFDEWLLWDFRSEQLATYETDLYEVNVNLDWYPDSRQEVRVKFQWAGVSSESLQGYGLASNGDLVNSNRPVDDFSVSDTALQIRYRYRIAPLSDFYLVYTRGGVWGDDMNTEGAWDLFNNAWDDVSSEQILAKIRLRF